MLVLVSEWGGEGTGGVRARSRPKLTVTLRHPARAGQVRLVLHTAIGWMMLDVGDAIPKVRHLAKGEFTTLRLRLPKFAARVVDAHHRVCIAFANVCPEADPMPAWTAALLRRRI